jgi:uncharacterized protein YggU (UPF0235/DUF167 family)
VRVLSRAARAGLGGAREGALVVKLTAPPVDGQANAALARLLARLLGVAPSAVTLVRGTSSRDKLLRVAGVRAADAHARLAGTKEVR